MSSSPPPWATALHDWPLGSMSSTQGKRRMEAPPSPRSLTTLFERMAAIHSKRSQQPAWIEHTDTRVRTAYGSYTKEELQVATPRQLSRTPSTQVRDYLNNRDKPDPPWTTSDLKPVNPRLQHLWQLHQEDTNLHIHRDCSLEEQTYACPSLSEKARRTEDRAKYRYSDTLRTHAPTSPHLQTPKQRLTYHLPPNWQLQFENFKHGWIYTSSKPASTSGSWSHEGTGAWFLNINGNCYPWRQEFDTTTGYTFLWLHGSVAIAQYPPFFWIHDQA